MATPTDPPNPFYFGYYPGEPIKPKRYYVPYKRPGDPIDWTGFDEYFDTLMEDVENVPRGVWNQIKRDFNATLKAQVRPHGSVSVEQLEAFGEEVVEDLPGAFGISVSLDPRDWAKDPTEEAKKTLKSWGSAAFNWNDFENQHRKELWLAILSDPDPTRGKTKKRGKKKPAPLSRQAAAAMSAGIEGTDIALGEEYSNPLSLDPLSGIVSREKGDKKFDTTAGAADQYIETPVYSSLKGKIADFQLNVKNATARESKYDGVLYSFALALKWDLDATAGPRTVEHTKAAKLFTKRVDLVTSVRTFKTHTSGRFGISNLLDSYILTGVDKPHHGTSISGGGVTGGVNGRLEGGVDKARKAMGELGLAEIDSSKNLVFDSEGLLKFDEKRLKAAGFSRAERNHLERAFNTHNKMLRNFEKLTETGGALEKFTRNPSKSSAVEAKRAFDDVMEQGKDAERMLLRGLERDMADDSNKLFEQNTAGGHKLKIILSRLERERSYAGVEEYLSALEDERLIRSYIWPRLKNKFEVLTPAYWSSKFLSRFHHFGLTVNDSMVDGNENLKWGIGRFSVTTPGGLGGLLLNKFRVNEEVLDKYKDASGKWVSRKVMVNSKKLVGGRHFALAGSMSLDAFNEDEIEWLFGLSLSKRGRRDLKTWDSLSDAFNDKFGKPLPFRSELLVKNFYDDFTKFDIWLRDPKNASMFPGLNLNTTKDRKLAFRSLAKHNALPDNLDISRKFVGGLEKVAAKLNKIQTKIMGSVVGKTVGTVVNLKTIVTERAADYAMRVLKKVFAKTIGKAVDWAIAGLLGSVTGGVGAVLWKTVGRVVKKVVYAVIRKGVDTITAFGKGVITGDFSKFWEESIGKTFDVSVKIFTRVLLLPILLIFLVVGFEGGSMLSAISPVMPAASGLGDISGGGGAPGGGGEEGPGVVECEGAPLQENDTCPLNNYQITTYAYDPSRQDAQSDIDTEAECRATSNGGYHGTNAYFMCVANRGGTREWGDCFSIPVSWLYGVPHTVPWNSGSPASMCTTGTRRPGFGFALDLGPRGAGPGTELVYLPDSIEGNAIDNWIVSDSQSTSTGVSSAFTGSGGGNEYIILFLHMAETLGLNDEYAPGSCIGGMCTNCIYGEHLHIEIAKNDGSGWETLNPEVVLGC